MSHSPKQPPRFVPTLTEAVPLEIIDSDSARDEAGASASASASPALSTSLSRSAPASALDTELRTSSAGAGTAPLASFHAPWRTDGLYQPGQSSTDYAPASLSTSAQLTSQSELDAQAGPGRVADPLDAQALVGQVLAQLHPVMAQKLQLAMDSVIQEQAKVLAERLGQELETVVRESVQQALEEALERVGQQGGTRKT